MKTALVIMAAGMGSCVSVVESKQLEPVGLNERLLWIIPIHDAIEIRI